MCHISKQIRTRKVGKSVCPSSPIYTTYENDALMYAHASLKALVLSLLPLLRLWSAAEAGIQMGNIAGHCYDPDKVLLTGITSTHHTHCKHMGSFDIAKKSLDENISVVSLGHATINGCMKVDQIYLNETVYSPYAFRLTRVSLCSSRGTNDGIRHQFVYKT